MERQIVRLTFLIIFVVTIPFTEIKEKVDRRLPRIILWTFSAKM
jgi:hypothetical protein